MKIGKTVLPILFLLMFVVGIGQSFAQILRDIQTDAEPERVKINIICDESVRKYNNFFLSDETPPKLVVDLPGKWFVAVLKNPNRKGEFIFDTDSDMVSRIRVGKHPSYLRLVLDMKVDELAPPKFEKTNNGLILRLARTSDALLDNQEESFLTETEEYEELPPPRFRDEQESPKASLQKSHAALTFQGPPADARPGECYKLCLEPAAYETVTEKVLIAPAVERIEYTDPEYEWQEEKVLVQEASEKIEIIPAKYEWQEEKVLVREASEKIEIIPAKYEWREEKIMVREASQKMEPVQAEYEWRNECVLAQESAEEIEVIPAKYEWREEKIMVNPPSTRRKAVPPYRTVQEKILVRPASSKWEKKWMVCTPEEIENGQTHCETMCLVEVPAKYKTITKQVPLSASEQRSFITRETTEVPAEYETIKKQVVVEPPKTRKITTPPKCKSIRKQVMVRPASVKEEVIPAEYKTIRKQVMVRPATTRKIPIPAEYKTEKKQVMVRPAQTRKVEIPAKYETIQVKKMVQPSREKRIPVSAKYETVTKEKKVSDTRWVWHRVICETEITAAKIREIQQALKGKGYYFDSINGEFECDTRKALTEFQKKNGLATGSVTLQTLDALDLSY